MVEVLSLFAAVVSVAALFVALTAHGEATAKERDKRNHKPSSKAVPAMNDADRRRMAVERKQHRNFMEYDGKPQTPIDENAILSE